MAAIKISSKIDERAWKALQKLSKETHRSISGLLTEAVQEYLSRRTIRQEVLDHVEDSMTDNEELGRLLAK
jgi:predicted transcriptional regulator